MPRHKQVTTCRESGGPLSGTCTCVHCARAVCEVCGAGEGSLTTNCPGEKVTYDRQQEVSETGLDYTDDRGWHLAKTRRSPRFEDTEVPPAPPRVDPRTVVAPGIDWTRVDRTMDLKRDLSLKAIAWVIADRACEDSAARERIAQERVTHLRGKQEVEAPESALLAALESEKIEFARACRDVERCDDEFRHAARQLVAALEEGLVRGGGAED